MMMIVVEVPDGLSDPGFDDVTEMLATVDEDASPSAFFKAKSSDSDVTMLLRVDTEVSYVGKS